MPYLQLHKGRWRVRKPIPAAVQELLGRGAYLTRSLGTADKAEANRLSVPVIAEFNEMIELAERGEWPPLGDEAIETIAHRWRMSQREPEQDDPTFDTFEEFAASIASHLAEKYPSIKLGGRTHQSIVQACRSEAEIIRDNTPPTLRPVKPRAAPSPVPFNGKPYLFDDLIRDWAAERKKGKRAVYAVTQRMTKFKAVIGKEDAAQVTEDDFLKWKDHLVKRNLSSKSIANEFNMVKTMFTYAQMDQRRIIQNPAAGVRYRKPKSNGGGGDRGWNDEETRTILLAARQQKEAHKRWVPWVSAFTGARVEEICGAMCADVKVVDGIHVLSIALDNRDEDATLKNEDSTRKVPLHPLLIEEGFLDYVNKLDPTGPLFPKVRPDRFGRRGGDTGGRHIREWIRDTLKLTDDKKWPNHAWRHRFTTICREAGIAKEYRRQMTGHASTDVSDDYGRFPVAVLFEQICKLPNPLKTAAG